VLVLSLVTRARAAAKCDFASIKWWRCWESNPGPNECTVKALARRNSITPPKGSRGATSAFTVLSTCSRRLHAFFYFVPDQRPEGGERLIGSRYIEYQTTPPRHHLACALRCLVGCGSPDVPIGEALRGQQATKRLVSLQRVIRLVRAFLPEVSEQLANLNG
jgi:hypothetical protein